MDIEPDELRRLGYHVIDRLVDHLQELDGKPPIAPVDPEWSVASVPLEGPSDPRAALDFLFDEVLSRGQLTNHPRFFARIGGPATPLAVLADLASIGTNAFAGSWVGGAGVSAVELAVLDWLRRMVGMPEGSEGVLVSGGSVGTLTALAVGAARVDSRDEATGYVSEHTHAAVSRAWHVLGFNPSNLRVLRADPQHRLEPPAIDAAIELDRAAGLQPFVVVATAGNTSTGAVDPLNDLADLARREGLWFHVDGAYGAPAALVNPDLLAGIERADSLVLDPHKWLFQPYECGCVLVREPGSLERAFHLDGAYLRDTQGSPEVNFRDRGLQLTRGSRALKLWLTLRVFGEQAIKDAIARGIALAELAERLMREQGGWEIVSEATLAIVCFRPEGADDEATDALVHAAIAQGFAAPSTTILGGRTVARLCTINPRTTEDDIRATVQALRDLHA